MHQTSSNRENAHMTSLSSQYATLQQVGAVLLKQWNWQEEITNAKISEDQNHWAPTLCPPPWPSSRDGGFFTNCKNSWKPIGRFHRGRSPTLHEGKTVLLKDSSLPRGIKKDQQHALATSRVSTFWWVFSRWRHTNESPLTPQQQKVLGSPSILKSKQHLKQKLKNRWTENWTSRNKTTQKKKKRTKLGNHWDAPRTILSFRPLCWGDLAHQPGMQQQEQLLWTGCKKNFSQDLLFPRFFGPTSSFPKNQLHNTLFASPQRTKQQLLFPTVSQHLFLSKKTFFWMRCCTHTQGSYGPKAKRVQLPGTSRPGLVLWWAVSALRLTNAIRGSHALL